jgi:[protein-PII] uridylyltransferase
VDVATLTARRRALVADDALGGREFGIAYTALVDEWITGLLGDEPGIAIVGGGALGRRELTPGSDLDLVLVHDHRRDVAQVAERVWYPIWDVGIALDHSVRTPKEAVVVAGDDLKVVLSLLDGRVIAGDAALGQSVLSEVRRRWVDGGRKRIGTLDEITRARHEKEGDVAHLLEPDLKQGKGGLRDLRVLHALSAATPVDPPGEATDAAGDLLLSVRVALHRTVRRPTDRLLLQYQDDVASRLGLPDADELMKQVAASGRAIAWASDDSWARVRSWRVGPRGRAGGGNVDLGGGLILRDGELDVVRDADLSDGTLILRAAEAAARRGVRFRRGALERLAGAAPPGEPWPPRARQTFVGLLGAGEPLVPVLEALEQHDLVTRLIPEWAPVRSRPQRNSFHRFTVDRHLVEAVVQASRLTRSVSRPDLLLVAALLHDLGKGYPGDHTKAGIALAEEIGPRLGFPPEDVAVLATLVREHLLLASVATSRDLSDPVTIDVVARAVGSSEVLALLAALTEADSLATGEGVWTTWKAALVDDLVRRVDAALGGVAPPASRTDHGDDAARRALVERAAGGLLVDIGEDGTHVTVVAPDRPGLLAAIVGVMAVRGQSVQSAVATTDPDGVAVDSFTIRPDFDREPNWTGLGDEIGEILAGTRDIGAAVEERSRRYRSAGTAAARPADPVVLVHLEAASEATVVEVRSPDDVGVLFRIARTLTGLGLDIHQARAVTLGNEVVDTFYVRDAHGAPVDARGPEITDALMTMLQAHG